MLWESGKNALSQGTPGIIPQAVLPFIENMSNHNFFLERSIIPIEKEDAPPPFQYSGMTSESAKLLGKWVNLSPAQIDNLFNQYSGSLGRYFTSSLDPILKGTGIVPNIEDPSMELSDIPVVKAFVVRDPYGSGSASVGRFYRKLEHFEGIEKAYKQLIAEGRQEEANKYVDNNPEARLGLARYTNRHHSSTAKALRAQARRMAEIRRIQREISFSKLSPKDKRDKLKELNRQITLLATMALKELPTP